MGPSTDDNFHLPFLHRWHKDFNTRRDRRDLLAQESIPYIEIQRGINPDSPILSLFTESDDYFGSNEEEAERLGEFCRETKSLQVFQTSSSYTAKPVALLDDTNSEGQHRIYPKALTAETLFEALSVPVSQILRRQSQGLV